MGEKRSDVTEIGLYYPMYIRTAQGGVKVDTSDRSFRLSANLIPSPPKREIRHLANSSNIVTSAIASSTKHKHEVLL